MARRFGPAFSPWRAGIKALLWSAAGYFLLLALATPLGAPIKVETQSSGADIILAVDVSSSMYAQDVAPNRILAVKAALGSFINRLQGDRVGVIAFAGEAVIACPLTTDYDTAQLFLDKLETDSVPQDGTGFAQAINLCLDGFAPDSKRGRMIIMATDGEDTLDEDASSEAKRAGSLGIPIFTLGVGTKGGAYIPGRPDVFGRVSPKMYHGQPIRVSVNPDTLRKISSLSGGEYFDGASQAGMNRAYGAHPRAQAGRRQVPGPLRARPALPGAPAHGHRPPAHRAPALQPQRRQLAGLQARAQVHFLALAGQAAPSSAWPSCLSASGPSPWTLAGASMTRAMSSTGRANTTRPRINTSSPCRAMPGASRAITTWAMPSSCRRTTREPSGPTRTP